MISPTLPRHPALYTIFLPNTLLDAEAEPMSLYENKTYYEILNHNHVSEPGRLIYDVHYRNIFEDQIFKNRNLHVRAYTVKNALQSRAIMIREEIMMEIFKKKEARSITPIPTIDYFPDFFRVELHKDFKTLLIRFDVKGFTKGDIELLRSFKMEVCFPFYWKARYNQARNQEWEIGLEDLKKDIGLEGKYADYKNFRRKILEPLHKAFQGTYVEFEFMPIKKAAGAVVAIRFIFKNGPREERDVPAGNGYQWESMLLKYGVFETKVVEFRHRVRAQMMTHGFVWDNEYINYSLEAFAKELSEKMKNKKRKEVRSTGAYLTSGLSDGIWLAHVVKRKAELEALNLQLQEQNQFKLFEDKKSEPVYNGHVASMQEVKELFRESRENEKMTFEQFLVKLKYREKDGVLVKIP